MEELRDFLLSSLTSLPGTRRFSIHCLASVPRKHGDLYPYAISTANPKVHAQDLLVLLAEESPGRGRVFVSAIESYLYTIVATSTAVLYVSKVDSTGQGLAPSPTSTLVNAFLAYFANPENRKTRHLWIHVFARAQNQYLFPNSVEHPSKRVLSDAKLCQWWKRLLESVASRIRNKPPPAGNHHSIASSVETAQIGAYYILPGMSEFEALQFLGALKKGSSIGQNSSSATPEVPVAWIYGHPYGQIEQPMPSGVRGSKSIAELIPFFPDDPKSRFLDELHAPTQVLHPPHPSSEPREDEDRHDSSNASERHNEKQSPISISPDEFWEMMSFRQECSSGAVTGFFVVQFSSTFQDKPSYFGPRAGQVSKAIIERTVQAMLSAHEFSTAERSLRSTEIIETSIRGLCAGLKDKVDDGTTGSQDSDDLTLYHRHIHSYLDIKNPPLDSSKAVDSTLKRSADSQTEEQVNVLVVKKKKKTAK